MLVTDPSSSQDRSPDCHKEDGKFESRFGHMLSGKKIPGQVSTG